MFHLEYKKLYARSQNDDTNKQLNHLENPILAAKNRVFFDLFLLLVFTITYHAEKIWYIYQFTLTDF